MQCLFKIKAQVEKIDNVEILNKIDEKEDIRQNGHLLLLPEADCYSQAANIFLFIFASFTKPQYFHTIFADVAADHHVSFVTKPDRPSCLFLVGEDSEEEADVVRTVDAETQTESVESLSVTTAPAGEVKTPVLRTIQECAALLKSEV